MEYDPTRSWGWLACKAYVMRIHDVIKNFRCWSMGTEHRNCSQNGMKLRVVCWVLDCSQMDHWIGSIGVLS